MSMKEELSIPLLQSFRVAKVHKDNTRLINSMDFDDNNSLVVTASDDESIRIYSLNSGKSNNILYCSTKQEDSIRYMSLHDNKYLKYFKGHTARVISMEMSPCDDTFMSASIDNTVRFWDLKSTQPTGMISTQGTNPLVAYDPSGKVVVVGLGNNSIRFYSTAKLFAGPFHSQPVVDPLFANPPEWTQLQFSNDGKYILVSTRGTVHYLLDAFKGDIIHRLIGHQNALQIPLQASFTPDAKFVLSGSGDGKIVMWNVETGELVVDLVWHHDPPRVVRFAPRSLLMLSAETNLSFWTPPPK